MKYPESQRTESTATRNPHKLSLLLELSRIFSALLELEDLVPCIIAKTKEVLEAESCAVLLLDETRQELFFPVISDVSVEVEERLKGFRFPAGKGLSGWVLDRGRPLLVPDVNKDERFYSEVDKHTGVQTRDLLLAPLRTRHETIGVIGVRNKHAGKFTEEDLGLLDELSSPVAVAIENAMLYDHVRQSETRLKAEVAALYRVVTHSKGHEKIVRTGPAMQRVFSLMESAITSSVTVLLEGETGTGKELIAQAIHDSGPRKDRPFVAVNCGALPETLLQSELFGHKKGAFTGAATDKQGLFEMAHGGTIFLDEVGETSQTVQVSLLRVLQESEIRRLGEAQSHLIDVRVISATNRDLAQDVRGKRFREDLFYRLSVFPIRLPPLRKRLEDIPGLVSHFIRRSEEKIKKRIQGITREALDVIMHYGWPGNVRELENEIERAVAITRPGGMISQDCLSDRIVAKGSLRVRLPAEVCALKQARAAFESEYLARTLDQNQGNVSQTAKVLGISRQMLQKKIKDYGLRS